MIDIRRKFILPYITNRKVLDLGCADLRYNNLHGFIVNNCKSVLGVDLNPGNDTIIYGDATQLKKLGSFDVVTACAILEHLDNFRGFFDSVKRNLNKDGLLIIDVPNAYCLPNRYGYKPHGEKTDHTCWFCLSTLQQLLSMNGFKIIEYKYHSALWNTLRSKLFTYIADKYFNRLHLDLIVVACRESEQ